MTSIQGTAEGIPPGVGLLDRERIIAGPGFNRWLVPPAALAIHLCIGMAYGFSVFWLPLSQRDRHRQVGRLPGRHVADPGCAVRHAAATGRSASSAGCTRCSSSSSARRRRSGAAGSSASARARPASSRRSAGAAACCISAVGVYLHQLWMMWLGSGVIGGIGLGLGYISPVSTLIKWFPDRRGMATGMAIMGFGGGAMIGAPLADMLMTHFPHPDSMSASGRPSVAMARDLLRVHDGRCLRLSRAAARLAARRLDAAARDARAMITHAPGAPAGRAQDAAVLADLGGAVPERQRRHRRHRHGLAHAAGDLRRRADRPADIGFSRARRQPEAGDRRHRRGLRRAAVAVQHRRTVLLGVAVGQDRPQDDLLSRSSCSASRSTRCRRARRMSAARRCSSPSSASSCRCMAAASRPCRPISPTCSARSSSAPSTAGC